MTALLYAMVTVVSWGTWIGVAQWARVRANELRTCYVTIGNLVLAMVVLLARDEANQLSWKVFWPPFLGGVVWAVGSFCAFIGTSNIGIARSAGVWTPLNIGMGFVWGVLLFGELDGASTRQLGLLGVALVVILVGLQLILFAKGADRTDGASRRRALLTGFTAALGAGIFWGSYFVPAQLSVTSPWVANLPLAAGMVTGGMLLVAWRGAALKLESGRDYAVLLTAGAMWGVGNLGMLLMIERIGTGKGFTIAQLSLLVNALVGIYLFRDPPPRSRAELMTLSGVLVAGAGGVLLGNLN